MADGTLAAPLALPHTSSLRRVRLLEGRFLRRERPSCRRGVWRLAACDGQVSLFGWKGARVAGGRRFVCCVPASQCSIESENARRSKPVNPRHDFSSTPQAIRACPDLPATVHLRALGRQSHHDHECHPLREPAGRRDGAARCKRAVVPGDGPVGHADPHLHAWHGKRRRHPAPSAVRAGALCLAGNHRQRGRPRARETDRMPFATPAAGLPAPIHWGRRSRAPRRGAYAWPAHPPAPVRRHPSRAG